MKRLVAGIGSFLVVLSIGGCVADPGSPDIPAWEGIPAQLLAPNSQEAYGWKMQHHERGEPTLADF